MSILKIKSVQEAGELDTCFCGKKAEYSVQLTNSKDHRPVCLSCLMDRLNKPGQSVYINKQNGETVFLQTFKENDGLFLSRRIAVKGSPDYSISFHAPGEERPWCILSWIKGERKAREGMKIASAAHIPWGELYKKKTDHPRWEEARELVGEIRKEIGGL